MTTRSLLALLASATLAACGGGADADPDRDLAMPPADSLPVLADQPPAVADTPVVVPPPAPASSGTRPAPAPAPVPAPAPAPPPAAAPAGRTLEAGTLIELQAGTEITSRTNKAGETFTATVSQAVTDAQGREVIPAGATVTMLIVALAPAANRGDTTGTLQLRATQVAFGGRSYEVDAPMTTATYQLKGRGVTTGDAAKVGVGAAAGAVAGRVLGGGGRGAVVGGIIGAATGAAVAAETADRDVVIAEGGRIVVSLRDPLTISGS